MLRKLVNVLNWVFGVLSLLLGIAILFGEGVPLIGVPFILISGLLLPPLRNLMHSKTGITIVPWQRALMILGLFFLIGVLTPEPTPGQIAKQETEKKEQELKAIQKMQEQNKQRELARQEKEQQLLEQIENTPESDTVKQYTLHKELWDLDLTNTKYKNEYLKYKKQFNALEEKRLASEAKQQQKLDRKKQIETELFALGNIPFSLEKAIKKQMKNPKSYDLDSFSYVDKGERIVIYVKFQGTNSFGATVSNLATAEMSLNGDEGELHSLVIK